MPRSNPTTQQLERRLPALQEAAGVFRQRPRGGWVRAIRTALSMSTTALANQVGITHSALVQQEKAEADGKINLATLKRLAEALDAELVYALVPRHKPSEVLGARARRIARERVLAVTRSMSLEDQAVARDETERQTEELAADLIRNPRRLWR